MPESRDVGHKGRRNVTLLDVVSVSSSSRMWYSHPSCDGDGLVFICLRRESAYDARSELFCLSLSVLCFTVTARKYIDVQFLMKSVLIMINEKYANIRWCVCVRERSRERKVVVVEHTSLSLRTTCSFSSSSSSIVPVPRHGLVEFEVVFVLPLRFVLPSFACLQFLYDFFMDLLSTSSSSSSLHIYIRSSVGEPIGIIVTKSQDPEQLSSTSAALWANSVCVHPYQCQDTMVFDDTVSIFIFIKSSPSD